MFAPKRAKGVAQPAAGRGRDRDRQDARLSRAGVAVGGAGGRHGVGLDLHQGAAAPARRAKGPSCSPTRTSARGGSSSARAARIICACSTSRMRCRARSRPRRDPRAAGRALGGLHQGRRHGRRRLAGLAAEPVPPRRRGRADRPPRRVRLCRLPALPPLLHRARRAGEPRGRHRHRQPRAGDGQCRARRARTRRGGSCSTRAIICSTPPIRPSRSRSAGRRRSSCGAGSSGPEGRSRGRRRGLAARLMDVASYDEEGGAGARRGGRGGAGAAVGRLAAAAGRGRAVRAGRGACSREVRGTVYARAKAQEAGYGLETELAEPDGALVSAAAAARRSARKRCRSRSRRWPGGSRRCSRMRPTGSMRRRGRGSKARSAGCRGGARRSPRGSRCSAGSAARPIPNSSTGSRSSGSTGANMTSRSTAAGSTRPSRSPAPCWRRPTACWSPRRRCAAARAGPAAEARTGALHLPAPAEHFEAESPFDYAACSEVLIVTDIKQGDIAALAGAYARLIEAARRRHARAVHRDPAVEGGACADRRPAGARRAAAARPACRSDRRRDAGRHLPRRSARLAARHRRACATGSTCPANRCGWW